jgi:hypothetical protein
MSNVPWTFGLAATTALIPAEEGALPFALALTHGGMLAGLYRPGAEDRQTPHDQPELYVVASGSGFIRKAAERRAISAGHLVFVEAGIDHRFEDYSEDLALWVIFWTPAGAPRAG